LKTVKWLDNRKIAGVFAALCEVFQAYHKRGFHITTVHENNSKTKSYVEMEQKNQKSFKCEAEDDDEKENLLRAHRLFPGSRVPIGAVLVETGD
jgi:hypothetical protein